MANINEVLRYLSEIGRMREAERIRRNMPETLLNIAYNLEQLKGIRQQRDIAEERREPTLLSLDLANQLQQENIEDMKLNRRIKENEFDYVEMTKQLRQSMPGVVEKYGNYTKGDQTIRDAGLTPNPLTRTVQGLIESGQTDLARRAEPEVFAELTRGIPESVRAARERSTGIGKNRELELRMMYERHNLEVEKEKLKNLGRLKLDEFRTLNNISEFLFKVSQGVVQIPLLLESIKAGEKLIDEYGSEYKEIVKGLRQDYENYKDGEINEEELANRVLEKYNAIKKQLDIATEEIKVNPNTGKFKFEEKGEERNIEENKESYTLSDEDMKRLPIFTGSSGSWRQKSIGNAIYIYRPNERVPFSVIKNPELVKKWIDNVRSKNYDALSAFLKKHGL
ncbi:MAG: hypothetical protein QXU40_02295 [Candidatus Pacearchaeota archaeon]